MKTKTVEYFVELYPGWEKGQYDPIICTSPPTSIWPGGKIYRIRMTLPVLTDSLPTIDAEVMPMEEA